jgi:hypothetical protein
MKLQHKFGGFNILKEKPLISLGWFSGGPLRIHDR